jgi:hypothetical protein
MEDLLVRKGDVFRQLFPERPPGSLLDSVAWIGQMLGEDAGNPLTLDFLRAWSDCPELAQVVLYVLVAAVSHRVIAQGDAEPTKWIDLLDECADSLHLDFGQCQAISLVWYILNADADAKPPPHLVDLLERLGQAMRPEALKGLLNRDRWPLSDDDRRRISELR